MKTLLTILFLLICAAPGAEARRPALDGVPSSSQLLPAFHPDTVKSRLSGLPLHEIEGIWEFAGEGTFLAIERESESAAGGSAIYRMVAVESPDLSLRPGTVMGYLTPTSKRGVYDARIYTSQNDEGTLLRNPCTFTVSLGDDGTRITIKPYGRVFRVNWWRFVLPYVYRSAISRVERPAGDIEGCVKVYPAPAKPLNPRYL